MTKTKYYKVLDTGGFARMGVGSWHLPVGKRPGKWMPLIKNVIPCHSGYHVCTLDMLPKWLGPEIYEVEVRGESVVNPDKHVFQQGRLLRRLTAWTEKSARLFAADCAEHVIGLYPLDPSHLRQCIDIARAFAHGQATGEELNRAQYDAFQMSPSSTVKSDIVRVIESAVAEACYPWAYSAAEHTLVPAIKAVEHATFGTHTKFADEYAAMGTKHMATIRNRTSIGITTERTWQVARLKSYLEIGDDD